MPPGEDSASRRNWRSRSRRRTSRSRRSLITPLTGSDRMKPVATKACSSITWSVSEAEDAAIGPLPLKVIAVAMIAHRKVTVDVAIGCSRKPASSSTGMIRKRRGVGAEKTKRVAASAMKVMSACSATRGQRLGITHFWLQVMASGVTSKRPSVSAKNQVRSSADQPGPKDK